MPGPYPEFFSDEEGQIGIVQPERYRSGRNGVDSKSTCPVKSGARGFESHPLRQNKNLTPLPTELEEWNGEDLYFSGDEVMGNIAWGKKIRPQQGNLSKNSGKY